MANIGLPPHRRWGNMRVASSRWSSGEFEPFKMMIGAIMALMILVIILSAIDFFYKFRIDVSTERLYTGIRNAVEQPNGKSLVVKDLILDSGTIFTSAAIARQVGLDTGPTPDACLDLVVANNSSFTSNSPESITVNASFQMDVYAVCSTNLLDTYCSCEVCCIVGFNKDPALTT